MNNLLTINDISLQLKEYQGKRVVTFKDIDNVHQRAEGTASRNFKANRKHFIKDEDYFEISRKEFKTNFVSNSEKLKGNPNVLVFLLTETGYLMIVKSFTDDLAWKVQRQLVNTYFKYKELTQQQQYPLPIQQDNFILNKVIEQIEILSSQHNILSSQMNELDHDLDNFHDKINNMEIAVIEQPKQLQILSTKIDKQKQELCGRINLLEKVLNLYNINRAPKELLQRMLREVIFGIVSQE